MHTIPNHAGDDTVRLSDLIDQISLVCLGTQGRLRRLNRFIMGAHLVMALTPEPLRRETEAKLLDVARDCGLAEDDPLAVRPRIPMIG